MKKSRNLLATITLFVLMCSCGIPEPLKYAEVESYIEGTQQYVELSKEFYDSNKEDINWLWLFFQQHPGAEIMVIKNGEEAGFSLYCNGGIHNKGPILEKPELLSVCEFYPSEVKQRAIKIFSQKDGVPSYTTINSKNIIVFDSDIISTTKDGFSYFIALTEIPANNLPPRGAIEIYDIEDDWKVMIAGSFLDRSIQDVRYYDKDGNVKE